MSQFETWPSGFVLHHSATRDGQTVSWPAIRKFHIEDPGHLWSDIGYHWGVELATFEYEALVGRPLDTKGAHCPQGGMNSKAWGVCLVGNFDKEPPPRAQLVVTFQRILVPLARLAGIKLSRATVTFHRHHALDGRTCPGKMFTDALLDQCLAEFATEGG